MGKRGEFLLDRQPQAMAQGPLRTESFDHGKFMDTIDIYVVVSKVPDTVLELLNIFELQVGGSVWFRHAKKTTQALFRAHEGWKGLGNILCQQPNKFWASLGPSSPKIGRMINRMYVKALVLGWPHSAQKWAEG